MAFSNFYKPLYKDKLYPDNPENDPAAQPLPTVTPSSIPEAAPEVIAPANSPSLAMPPAAAPTPEFSLKDYLLNSRAPAEKADKDFLFMQALAKAAPQSLGGKRAESSADDYAANLFNASQNDANAANLQTKTDQSNFLTMQEQARKAKDEQTKALAAAKKQEAIDKYELPIKELALTKAREELDYTRNKNDPTSSVSLLARTLAERRGIKVDANTSAAALEKLEPGIKDAMDNDFKNKQLQQSAEQFKIKEANDIRKEALKLKADAEKGKVVPLKDKIEVEQKFRKEIDDKFKDYDNLKERMQAAENLMSTSDKKVPNKSDDQAFLIMFNKILDPNSVVKESEFDRAANVGSAFDKIRAARDSYLGTGNLTPEMRSDILKTMRTIVGAADGRMDRYLDNYRKTIEGYGLDMNNIMQGRVSQTKPIEVKSESKLTQSISPGVSPQSAKPKSPKDTSNDKEWTP